jgi:transposase-like protein
MHKSGNVLNYVPKSVQPEMKLALHYIWQAETLTEAEKAFETFEQIYEPKYPKAVQCLQQDRDETNCRPSTMSLRSTGRASVRPTRSSGRLERYATGPSDQKDAWRATGCCT